MSRALGIGAALALAAVGASPAAAQGGWTPFAGADVVRIVTQDEDGGERDTPVWIVLVDGAPYVRTNDSRWLANIRRGSEITLRLDHSTRPVSA